MPPPYEAHTPTMGNSGSTTANDGASTLALKSMDGVNRSPKQRVSVAPQNSEIFTAKN